MRDSLDRAATHFGATATDEPIFGWRLRSINSLVRHESGQRAWLRVVSEQPRWLPGDFWTGNVDANIFVGIAKPRVTAMTEWDDQYGRRVRAELMTLMPGGMCSPTDTLRHPVGLSGTWWSELRRTIGVVRSTPTVRVSANQEKIDGRVQTTFGNRVRLHVEHWETVHGDLHWANLLTPDFGLLDWELWGRGPAGTDAATLYCYSLLVPAMARAVHRVFADVLDTTSGKVAQIAVAARILARAEQDYPDLADPLRWHADRLIDG